MVLHGFRFWGVGSLAGHKPPTTPPPPPGEPSQDRGLAGIAPAESTLFDEASSPVKDAGFKVYLEVHG